MYVSPFHLMILTPPQSPRFPYTTLFRSPASRRTRARKCEGEIGGRSASGGRHDCPCAGCRRDREAASGQCERSGAADRRNRDRKSTRLNSSHLVISYAVFCLKKKTQGRE